MKSALQKVGTGEVAVYRSGPTSAELGYVWTISFLETQGDVDLIQVRARVRGSG